MKAFPATSAYGSMTILSVNVTNLGRRPTSVTHVSLLLPKRADASYLLCADPLTATYPVELTENKGHSFVMNGDDIKARYRLTPDRYIIRVDTTGQTYWSHRAWARWWKLGRTR
jgi:hypothetical protein